MNEKKQLVIQKTFSSVDCAQIGFFGYESGPKKIISLINNFPDAFSDNAIFQEKKSQLEETITDYDFLYNQGITTEHYKSYMLELCQDLKQSFTPESITQE